MSEYTDQIRALSYRLQEGEDIPLVSVIVTLREAAEKIDYFSELLEAKQDYVKLLLENRNVTF